MDKITNLNELIHKVYLKAVDCVFNADMEIANNLLEMTNMLRSELERFLKELIVFPILRTVVLELARIADNGPGIAVIATNKALEMPSKICNYGFKTITDDFSIPLR
jgi:hypothetical protein